MTFKYEVVVKTGDHEDAGTDREVWFKIEGSLHTTPWIHFDDLRADSPQLFRPGQIAFCEFTSEQHLGELHRIWLKLHPQDAPEPDWLVDTFEVMHGETSDLWTMHLWVTPDTPLCAGPERQGTAVSVAPVSRASERNSARRFVATTDGPNKLGLRELLQTFANEQRVTAHMTPEQAAESVLEVFKRAVKQEMELLGLEGRESD